MKRKRPQPRRCQVCNKRRKLHCGKCAECVDRMFMNAFMGIEPLVPSVRVLPCYQNRISDHWGGTIDQCEGE